MLRKLLIVSLAVLVLAGSSLLLRDRVVAWDRGGWAGLSYQPKVSLAGTTDEGAPALERSAFRVQAVAPHSPAAQAGIHEGDEILSIDGISTKDLEALRRLAASARAGDSLTYTVESGGAVRELSLTLRQPFRSAAVVLGTATSAFVGVSFLLISLLVAWSRTSSRPALVFFFMSLSGGVFFLLWGAGSLDYPSMRGIVPSYASVGFLPILGVATALSLFMTNLFLHFALVFPRPRPALERWPQAVVWLHTLPFLPYVAIAAAVLAGMAAPGIGTAPLLAVTGSALVALCVGVVLRIRRMGWRAAAARSPLLLQLVVLAGAALAAEAGHNAPAEVVFRVGVAVGVGAVAWLLLIVIAYSILTCVALYRSYRDAGVEEKHQVRWPLWGTIVTIVGAVLVTGIMILTTWLVPPGATLHSTVRTVCIAVSKLLYLLIPVSFAFGIVKYRLMDIDLIIRKTVLYSAVTGLVIASFLVLAATLGVALVRFAGVESPTAAVFVTLVVVALVIPLRARVQAFVDARLGRRSRGLDEALGRVRRAATHSNGLDAFLSTLVEEVQQAVQCRTVAALRRGPGSAALTAAAKVGIRDAALAELRLAADSPLLRQDEAVISADAPLFDDAERRALAAAEAALVLPGQGSKGSAEIVLLVGRKLSREPYEEEETAFLAAATETALLALARADGERAEAEFAQARTIQEALLPTDLPRAAGVELAAHWKPAREVGGDYFDVLALTPAKLALCIADVSGKGVPAALLMSNLQALLRAAATADARPERVCSQVRAGLARSLSGGRFVTLFYCVLDTESGALSYCNAGHDPPLLARRSGSVERLAVTGPALARVLAAATFGSADARLERGDRLVLYTDGVTEALAADDTSFGEGRLREVLVRTREADAEMSQRAITDAVIAFTGGEAQDDLTVLVARFCG